MMHCNIIDRCKLIILTLIYVKMYSLINKLSFFFLMVLNHILKIYDKL